MMLMQNTILFLSVFLYGLYSVSFAAPAGFGEAFKINDKSYTMKIFLTPDSNTRNSKGNFKIRTKREDQPGTSAYYYKAKMAQPILFKLFLESVKDLFAGKAPAPPEALDSIMGKLKIDMNKHFFGEDK